MSNENPARWVPDPMGRHEYRYWDGSQWTDHVADNGVTGIDAPLPTPDVVVDHVAPAVGASGATAAWAGYRRLPPWAQVVIPTVAVVVGLGAIGSLTSSRSSSPKVIGASAVTQQRREASPSPTTTTSTTTTTTTSVPPTTVPPPTEPPTLPPPPPTAPPAPAPTAGGCDPNYSGCVPIAFDVDCAGGSGNGPAYVSGPVQVIGTDIYGLDSDHDGIGCESD